MRKTRPIFHMFYEGKTEESYFQSLSNKYQIKLNPYQNNSKAAAAILLKNALKHKNSARNTAIVSPQVYYWLVFDEDQNPDTHAVMQAAKKAGIQCAYSNPCFELWLTLHFESNPPFGQTAEQMGKFLKKYDANYDKDGRKSIRFDEYYSHIQTALKNTKALGNLHQNPSTTNDVLIDLLQSLRR